MKKTIFLFLFSFILILAEAKQLIRFSITKGYRKRISVVYPASYLKGMKSEDIQIGKELEEVIRHDLELSGRISLFSASDEANSLAKKESMSKTDFEAWAKVGTEFLLKTETGMDLGVPKVSFVIYDCLRKQQLGGKKRSGSKKDYIQLGHEISDDILLALTGKRGLGLTRIAYVSNLRGEKTIYSCDVNGKEVTQLVNTQALIISPCWGPNRESILYTSYQNVNPGIFIKYLNSGRIESIALFPGLNTNGRLNGQNELVFTASKDGNPEIYVKNLNTGIIKRLTKRRGVDASPAWSPDNKIIAFVSSETGISPQVYLMNRDGSNIRRLTFGNNYNSSPAFSPDGKYLAYASVFDKKFCIALYDFAENNADFLVKDMGDAEAPCWAPDSLHVAFSSNKTGKYQIYIVDIETREIKPVTGPLHGNCTNPTWA
ncbi:MAG: PD40 domain-containing protein [Candidatus Aureabacteria bacterium]|nr:PD40 domain-containing protein [Candidatus Auribacterota bacterium]